MGRFTDLLRDGILQSIDEFIAAGGRTWNDAAVKDIFKQYKTRLRQIGSSGGSAMFEAAKQSIVDEGVQRVKEYLARHVPQSVVIRNPEGTYSIGEPAPRPAPIPHGYGHPVHFRLTPSTRYS